MIRAEVILRNMGRIILIVGVAMLTSLIWSLLYQEDVSWGILQAAALTIVVGLILSIIFKNAGQPQL